MTTTDHRAEALRLLTPGETHDAGEWSRACPTPDQALVHAVLHLADQLRPADVHGGDHAREGDGTTDPRSGRETGAQRHPRLKVGDRVVIARGPSANPDVGVVWAVSQATDEDGVAAVEYPTGDYVPAFVEDIDRVRVQLEGPGTVIAAGADGYCEVRHDDDGRVSITHVSWLEPLPPVEPGDAGPAITARQPITDLSEWLFNRYRTPHAVWADLSDGAREYWEMEADGVRRAVARLSESTDPSPGPVVLPTSPGSVAWTRDGGVFALTDDDDWAPWYALAGPRRRNRLDRRLSGYLSAGELLALDVVRVRDAGGGA